MSFTLLFQKMNETDLNSEQKGFIVKIKKQIKDLQSQQDIIYEQLVKELNLEKYSEQEKKLYDYIFNN